MTDWEEKKIRWLEGLADWCQDAYDLRPVVELQSLDAFEVLRIVRHQR